MQTPLGESTMPSQPSPWNPFSRQSFIKATKHQPSAFRRFLSPRGSPPRHSQQIKMQMRLNKLSHALNAIYSAAKTVQAPTIQRLLIGISAVFKITKLDMNSMKAIMFNCRSYLLSRHTLWKSVYRDKGWCWHAGGLLSCRSRWFCLHQLRLNKADDKVETGEKKLSLFASAGFCRFHRQFIQGEAHRWREINSIKWARRGPVELCVEKCCGLAGYWSTRLIHNRQWLLVSSRLSLLTWSLSRW